MGNLLRLLSRDGDSCCALPKSDIFVDFESARPTIQEEIIYREADCVLVEAEAILKEIQNYKGASKEIREALSTPSLDTEKNAWDTLIPLVLKLRSFYDFSKKIEALVPKIFGILCEKQPLYIGNVTERLDEHQALVKQFAKILEFVSKFDELKMMNPALQNDFSYFRRTSQRLRNGPSSRKSAPPCAHSNRGDQVVISSMHNSYEEIEEVLPIDVTNLMSLFFAHATPMLQSLSSSVTSFVDENAGNPVVANMTIDMLSMMEKICQKMLDIPDLKSRIQNEETEIFILRVMVSLVILYDHVHPDGAFTKGSQVDVKGCVRVLRDQDKTRAESLLNALRYTTKHLNDENTPKSVKTLLTFNVKQT